MSAFETLAELPIEVSSYELDGRDREYGSFTRPSTIVRLRGAGQEGSGRTSSTASWTTSPIATPGPSST